jgi:hypothetical protein
MNYLNTNNTSDCSVCYSETEYISKCCSLSICEKCYIEWLKTSRECMHCHKDQMEFQEWVDNFKQSSDEEFYSIVYVNGNVADASSNLLYTILEANVENLFDSFINGFLYNDINSDNELYDLYTSSLDEDIIRELFADFSE